MPTMSWYRSSLHVTSNEGPSRFQLSHEFFHFNFFLYSCHRATCASDLWHIPIRWHVSYKNVFFGLKRKSPRGYYVVHIKLLHHIIYHTIEAYVASADYNIIPSFSYLRKNSFLKILSKDEKIKHETIKPRKKTFPCLAFVYPLP